MLGQVHYVCNFLYFFVIYWHQTNKFSLCRLSGAVQFWCSFWTKMMFLIKSTQTLSLTKRTANLSGVTCGVL